MIRRAIVTDIEVINNLLSQVLEIHAKGRPDIFKTGTKKFSDEELLELIKDDNKPIFVYEENGKVLGYVFVEYEIERNSHSKQDRKSLFIEDFCVDEKYRKKGIATELFKYCELLAKKEKCNSITLNVWHLNNGAIAFYEKMGMNPLKTIMEKSV